MFNKGVMAHCRDIVRPPTRLDRRQTIRRIHHLVEDCRFCDNVLLTAAHLVDQHGEYSEELAIAATIVSSAYWEDCRLSLTSGKDLCNNGLVTALCQQIMSHVQRHNYQLAPPSYLDLIITILQPSACTGSISPLLSLLTYQIALQPTLLTAHPITIVVALLCLQRRRHRLRATTAMRYRKFTGLFRNLAAYYELPVMELLRRTMALRRSS